MNNSSAPPPGNPLPQGEKRKRDSELPPPPQNTTKAAATRARIVEILANTANGCLSELGYFPGMPARLKELEQQNATWKEENVKLYQDNRQLLAMVKQKSRQLELYGTSDSERVQKIMDLENEVHLLKAEIERLRSNAQYVKLLDDYRKLTESYRMAYSEVGRLSAQLQAATAQLLPAQQVSHTLQRSQSISHMQRPVMVAPQSQPSPMVTQGGHPLISPSAVVPQHPSIQKISQLGHRNDLSHPQLFQNRQHPGSNPGSRRSSLISSNVPPSQGPYSPAQPIPPNNFQPPQIAPSPHSPYASFLPPDHQNMRRASASTAVGNPVVANPYPVLPPQSPITRDSNAPGGRPYLVPQTVQPVPIRRHSQPVDGSIPRTGSAPLPSQTSISSQFFDPQVPPPPLSASSVLAQSSLLPSQPHAVSQSEQASQPSVQTVSPQETYINPPSQLEAVIATAAPLQPFNFETLQSPQGPDSEKNGSSSLDSTVLENAPAVADIAPAPVPHVQQTSLSFSNERGASPSEAKEMYPAVNPGPRQSVSTNLTDSAAESAPETSAPGDSDQMQVDAVESGEESEEEVELGPDGLRLVRDCLEELFGEFRVGEVICRLCEARFTQKVVDLPPTPFIDPTDDQLEAHCIEEHQLVWEELRRPD